MAHNTNEDFLQLIKRAGSFLTVKISNLFRHLFKRDSRAFGTVAGLALAIVFIWRLLRTLRGPQRRQSKRQAPSGSSSGVSSHASVSSASLEVSNPEDSGAQNVVDEFFQPVKPTLSQIVRQRLNEGSKVTCRLLGVILEESSPEELQKQATVRSSVLEVLLEITKFCDLYFMERVLDDESEKFGEKSSWNYFYIVTNGHRGRGRLKKSWMETISKDTSHGGKKVLMALEDAGVFTSSGLAKDKVLFCSTENGPTSFVRQLEPDWHIDSNTEIVAQLARFIKYQLHISPVKLERFAPNVYTATSLEHFFGCV
ncbi:hypothetical protein OROGR_015173 [Orobanche gracilis]